MKIGEIVGISGEERLEVEGSAAVCVDTKEECHVTMVVCPNLKSNRHQTITKVEEERERESRGK